MSKRHYALLAAVLSFTGCASRADILRLEKAIAAVKCPPTSPRVELVPLDPSNPDRYYQPVYVFKAQDWPDSFKGRQMQNVYVVKIPQYDIRITTDGRIIQEGIQGWQP